jgi:hypothetical protein
MPQNMKPVEKNHKTTNFSPASLLRSHKILSPQPWMPRNMKPMEKRLQKQLALATSFNSSHKAFSQLTQTPKNTIPIRENHKTTSISQKALVSTFSPKLWKMKPIEKSQKSTSFNHKTFHHTN